MKFCLKQGKNIEKFARKFPKQIEIIPNFAGFYCSINCRLVVKSSAQAKMGPKSSFKYDFIFEKWEIVQLFSKFYIKSFSTAKYFGLDQTHP